MKQIALSQSLKYVVIFIAKRYVFMFPNGNKLPKTLIKLTRYIFSINILFNHELEVI